MSTYGYGQASSDTDDWMTDVPINPKDGERYLCNFESAEVVMTKNEATGEMEPMRDEANRGARKIRVTFMIAEGECAGCTLDRKFHFGPECNKKMRDKFWAFMSCIGISEPRTRQDLDRIWPKAPDPNTGELRKAKPWDVIAAQFANGEQAYITCKTFTPPIQQTDEHGQPMVDKLSGKPVMGPSNETYYMIGWGEWGRPPFLLERVSAGVGVGSSAQSLPPDDKIPF